MSRQNYRNPYYQLSYTRKAKSRTEAVRPEHLDQVRSEIANYHKLLALIDRWVDACIELDQLRRSAEQRSAPGRRG